MQYTRTDPKGIEAGIHPPTQRYSSYMREPMELDMRAEDPPYWDGVRTAGCSIFGTVQRASLAMGAVPPHACGGCRGCIMHDAAAQPHGRAFASRRAGVL